MAARRLTPATEQLLMLIEAKCPGAAYEEARGLAEASARAETTAMGERILQRIARGEGRHYHTSHAPAATDVLTRVVVEGIVRSEAGM